MVKVLNCQWGRRVAAFLEVEDVEFTTDEVKGRVVCGDTGSRGITSLNWSATEKVGIAVETDSILAS